MPLAAAPMRGAIADTTITSSRMSIMRAGISQRDTGTTLCAYCRRGTSTMAKVPIAAAASRVCPRVNVSALANKATSIKAAVAALRATMIPRLAKA